MDYIDNFLIPQFDINETCYMHLDSFFNNLELLKIALLVLMFFYLIMIAAKTFLGIEPREVIKDLIKNIKDGEENPKPPEFS